MATKSGITQRTSTEIIPSSELPEFNQAIVKLEGLEEQVAVISKEARSLKVESAADFARAGELTAQLKEVDKTNDNTMAPYKQILQRVSDFIKTKKLRVSNKVEETKGVLSPKMAEYTTRERRRAEAEQEKERQARMQRESQAIKEDQKAGLLNKGEAKQALKQAEQEVAKVTVAPNIPSVAGVVKRTNYTAFCNNQIGYIRAVCEAYKKGDHATFDRLVLMIEVSNQRLAMEARETKNDGQMEKMYPCVTATHSQTF